MQSKLGSYNNLIGMKCLLWSWPVSNVGLFFLLLHLVGPCFIYVDDAQSNTHQIFEAYSLLEDDVA